MIIIRQDTGGGRPTHPFGRSAGWIAAVMATGLAIGVSVPRALEGSLEAYMLPLIGLAITAIFAMPRKKTFSDRACWIALLIFIVLYSVYPHYIALRVTGLPWISPIRLALAFLLFFSIYAFRQSPSIKADLRQHIIDNRLFFAFLAIFIAAQILSLPTARDPAQALTRFLLFQLTWVFPLLATLALVRTDRRIRAMAILFVSLAAIQCIIGFVEARLERLIWLDYLPPGFGADNDFMLRIIAGQFRGGAYRVQGSFTVSLIYAEFLVLMLPFAALIALEGRTRLIRCFGLTTAIAILPAQLLSGARLGIVGSIVVGLLLVVIHVTRVMRANKRSMLGPFMALLLPFALAAFAAAYVASPRLQTLTIGGGQHQASTDSRLEQFTMAIPRILERPLFGHGVGLGAEALGFRSPTGVLTIDSYALSLVLEVGVVGFVAFLGMIALSILTGVRLALQPGGGQRYLGGAVALSLTGFLFTKLVLSQPETTVLVFIMMGFLLALRKHARQVEAPGVTADGAVTPPSRYGRPAFRGARKLQAARLPRKAGGRPVAVP